MHGRGAREEVLVFLTRLVPRGRVRRIVDVRALARHGAWLKVMGRHPVGIRARPLAAVAAHAVAPPISSSRVEVMRPARGCRRLLVDAALGVRAATALLRRGTVAAAMCGPPR